jgi:hypothetical protein
MCWIRLLSYPPNPSRLTTLGTCTTFPAYKPLGLQAIGFDVGMLTSSYTGSEASRASHCYCGPVAWQSTRLGDFLLLLFAICFLLHNYWFQRLCLFYLRRYTFLLCMMSDTNKAFYITSVSNGHVLANKSDGRPSDVVVENKGDQSDAEKWTIEASDEPNKIALKNAANGRYLRANGNKCWATVGTGEKQWWKITSDGVTAPGACRLSPAEYPDVSLNHFQGKAVRRGGGGVKVHMWTFLV